MLLAARRQNGIGEDSSGPGHEKKKNMRWERIEDAEGMRSRTDFEPRSLESESSVLTITLTPQDQLMEVTGCVT